MYADPIIDWFKEEREWPPFGVAAESTDPIPIWLIGLMWLTLGTAFFLVLTRIEFIKGSTHKNAVLVLALGISGVAISSTAFVNTFVSIFGLTSFAASILAIITIISLVWGLGHKAVGVGSELAAEGKETIKDMKDVEGKEETEKRMLSTLEKIESDGITKAEHIREYLAEINRLLRDTSQLKGKKLRQRFIDRLSTVQATARGLKLDVKEIERLKEKVRQTLTENKRILRRNMETKFNTFLHSSKVVIPAGSTLATERSKLSNYLNTLEASLKTGLDIDNKINQISVELGGTGGGGGKLKEFLDAFENGIAALRSRKYADAQTDFGVAFAAIEEIRAQLAELERLEEQFDTRINTDLNLEENIEEHLRRATIIISDPTGPPPVPP
ncbi:hypothetical protein CMO88_02185 [Candidatus Woesearchaeota archaeon]|nr:hypothetical protein [Candidatus Woesearchaeota archaeon]